MLRYVVWFALWAAMVSFTLNTIFQLQQYHCNDWSNSSWCFLEIVPVAFSQGLAMQIG